MEEWGPLELAFLGLAILVALVWAYVLFIAGPPPVLKVSVF